MRYIFCIAALLTVLATFTAAEAVQTDALELMSRQPPQATKRLAYGTDPSQFGELWLPSGPGPYPVVVMIHGGCWHASLPGVVLMAHIAEDIRQSGVAVWNIEYRRLGNGGGYPTTFLDIADGMDYLRKISGRYKLDLSHVVAVGHSAGGHLALWAAARNNIKTTSELHREHPLPIRVVVTLAGADDLKAFRNNGAFVCGGPGTIDQLINDHNVRGRAGVDPYADTSPAAMLPLNVEQVIVSGTADTIVPDHFGRDYAALAKAAGDRVRVIDIEGAGHFDVIDPSSNGWKEIKAIILSYTGRK